MRPNREKISTWTFVLIEDSIISAPNQLPDGYVCDPKLIVATVRVMLCLLSHR